MYVFSLVFLMKNSYVSIIILKSTNFDENYIVTALVSHLLYIFFLHFRVNGFGKIVLCKWIKCEKTTIFKFKIFAESANMVLVK